MNAFIVFAALALLAAVAATWAWKIRRSGSFRVWVQRVDAPADAAVGISLALPALWLLAVAVAP